MDPIYPRPVQTVRDDPQDNDPKGGGFDEVGTGKSDKKPATGSGKDQSAG